MSLAYLMCGIAGKVYFNHGQIDPKDLKVMSAEISHRGPDDEGIFLSQDKKVGLVNRRLAIIDLTSAGHQPLFYKERYVITFNGEIYNFQKERVKLERQGYKFTSSTDTEVILALYDRYKVDCLKYLRGMFAFAIYDRNKNAVFLARDRLGKKPLKYYKDDNVFIFSSELKSIVTQKEVTKSPDYLAIHHYLTYGYVPPPQTGFEKIYKLAPASYIYIDMNSRKFVKGSYWDLDFSTKLTLPENEWCERIITELKEATKLRMIADVPLGTLLSGGVDSSTVVALMSQFSKKKVKTFTVGFKEEDYDETKYAEKISEMYDTEHTKLIAEPESIEILPKLVYQYEEPYADSSAVITYMVSKLARKHVTVILTGDGGDENFAGYPRFCRLKRDTYLDSFQWLLRPFAIPLTNFLYSSSQLNFLKRANAFFLKSKLPLADRFVTYNSYFKNEDKEKIYSKRFLETYGKTNSYQRARDLFAKVLTNDNNDRGLYFELKSYLPESQLTKVDIATMSTSLEARSPFLDQNVVELVAKIPYNLKVKGRCENKYILKKAVEPYIPKENIYRRKMGFTIPLSKWFTGKLNEYAKSRLLAKSSYLKNFIQKDVVKDMLMSHREKNDFGPQLWSLLTLELWFQSYFK